MYLWVRKPTEPEHQLSLELELQAAVFGLLWNWTEDLCKSDTYS